MQLWQAPYSAGGDQGLLHLAAETLGILPYPHGKYIIYIDIIIDIFIDHWVYDVMFFDAFDYFGCKPVYTTYQLCLIQASYSPEIPMEWAAMW